MKSCLAIKALVFIVLLFPWNNAFCTDEALKPITIVGTVDNPPFSFVLPDGTATGLYVEFWQLWSARNNIPVDIVLTNFDNSLSLVQKGGAVHAGLFINEERKVWAEFSLPIHKVDSGILYNQGFSKNSKIRNILDLEVSAQALTYQAGYIEENIPSANLTYHVHIEQGINKLLNNEVQAIVAEVPAMKAQLAKRGLLGVFTLADEILLTNTVHAVVAKGQPKLLNMIDKGITNIPIENLLALEKKWLPGITPFFKDIELVNTLTMAEKKWLKNNSVFRLGIESSWYPFEFVDESGQFRGVAADYVHYASQGLDIDLIPEEDLSWSEAFDMLKVGKIDVMSGVVKSPERQKFMHFTDPFIAIPGVIVIQKNALYVESIDDLKGRKVGIVKGYILVDSVSRDYPESIIYEVDSVADGLEKVQSGEIDAYIGSIAVVNYEMNKRQIQDLIIAAFTPYNFEISMAVRKGLEPLVNILNKTFESMSDAEKKAIADNWLSVHVQAGADIKVLMMWGLPIVLFLLLVLLFILRMNRKLKNEISIRKESELERHLLEGQLYQSQKMESRGKLTGGIAHDFNNILGVIIGYSELLKNEMPEQLGLAGFADEINEAGERGVKLTNKLLSYTRKDSLESNKVDINDVLGRQQDMLQKTLTVRIKLFVELGEGVWPILVDINELEDTLLNLSINAMHAMEKKVTAAKLSIKTSNLLLEDDEARLLGLNAGEYVQLNILDNGCGIEKGNKEKIFDPFYTTKGDKGSGLGLSQVYGFMQRSGGAIKVYSTPEEGSQFVLFFPRLIEHD